jgi:pimeloyl-ACP methyl ester carboxylesterase
VSIALAGRRLMARSAAQVQYADLAACHAYAPPMEAIRGLAVPALVVAGTRDQMTPMRAGQALAAEIPGARLAIVDSGHAMTIEAPREVLAALRDHFAG